jgi:arylsulfatase A-like enzyme
MALSLIFSVSLAASMRNPEWDRRLRPFTRGWAVAAFLLVYPCSRAINVFSDRVEELFGLFCVLLICTVFRGASREHGRVRFRWRSALLGSALVVLILASDIALTQRPIRTRVSPAIAPRSHHPNVILITLDTVRADHLSVYGYHRDTSPNLEKLARESSLFTNAVAAGNMTLSTHGSIFTGLYASQHGAHWVLDPSQAVADGAGGGQFGLRLPENSATLARKLAGEGYRTVGIAANSVYLRHEFQLDQGFEYYSQPNPVLFGGRVHLLCVRALLVKELRSYLPAEFYDREFVRAAEINNEAFRFFEERKSDRRPLFLFLNYMDAHQPYYPPAPYDTKYGVKGTAPDSQRQRRLVYDVLRGIKPYPEEVRRRDEAQYDGGIAYLDAELGRLFGKLRELGMYDDSLIIVTSDHGQSFGSNGVVGHGFLAYQSQLSVPLIVKYPGAPHVGVVHDWVSQVDLFPTVLDALGYSLPPKLAGRSLLRPPPARLTVISEAFPCAYTANLNSRFGTLLRAEYLGGFKLITGVGVQPELYNLETDPGEQHNLYTQDPEISHVLEARLQSWVTTLPVQRSRPAMLQKQMLDRLRSLGYLQ